MEIAYRKVVQSGTMVEEYTYASAPTKPKLDERQPRRKRPKGLRLTRNVKQARKAFYRLVRANLDPQRPPVLLTLTMREITSLEQAWKSYTVFFNRLRKLQPAIKTVGVPEFQKRGAVHFHVLVWNLDVETVKTERRSRRIARLWGHGFVDIAKTDGNPKLSTYLGKYMSKAMHDERLFGKRAYSASRNVLRPVSLSTPLQIETAYNVWGLGVDSVPLRTREYGTFFLGRCVYKEFLVEINL